MNKIDKHLANVEAEMEYEQKKEQDRELYEVVIEDEDFIITGMDYTKKVYHIEGLEDCSKGFYKKPFKGRKPGERN